MMKAKKGHMKPVVELVLMARDADVRHQAQGPTPVPGLQATIPAPPLGYVPRVSGVMEITIEEKEDHLPALVQAIDKTFMDGARVDLKAFPLSFIQSFEINGVQLKDEHWAAYARLAGLDFVPDALLRERVLDFYRSGRQA